MYSHRQPFDIQTYHQLTGWITGFVRGIESANMTVNVELIVQMNIGPTFQIQLTQLCLTIYNQFCMHDLLSAIIPFVYLMHFTYETDLHLVFNAL